MAVRRRLQSSSWSQWTLCSPSPRRPYPMVYENVDYGTQTLTATGGDGSYTWSIVSGSLPTGLSVAANGDITGAPTVAGISDFTVEVTSGGQTDQQALSVTVEAQAALIARTSGSYPWDTANCNGICAQEFGAGYELADWLDVRAHVDAFGLQAFYSASAMTSYRTHAWVTNNGSHLFGTGRHYFIERHDGQVPAGWLVHSSIGANDIDLGSWVNSRPALCLDRS